MRRRWNITVIELLIILALVWLVGSVGFFICNALFDLTGKPGPGAKTRANLGGLRNVVWCYGNTHGRWPDPTSWQRQLIEFDAVYTGVRDLQGLFVDAWDRPMRYEVRTDSGGRPIAVMYSTGKDGIDDHGGGDDIVVIEDAVLHPARSDDAKQDDDLNVTTKPVGEAATEEERSVLHPELDGNE